MISEVDLCYGKMSTRLIGMSCVSRWGACGSVRLAILKFRIKAFVQRPEHDEREDHADI